MKKNLIPVTIMVVVLILGAVAPGFAKAIPGPIDDVKRIPAYSSRTFSVGFRGGETARVAVVGDGDTDLDLYIYDEYGRLVAEDEDLGDVCLASWVPRRTAYFTIKVVNRGNVYNDCEIATN